MSFIDFGIGSTVFSGSIVHICPKHAKMFLDAKQNTNPLIAMNIINATLFLKFVIKTKILGDTKQFAVFANAVITTNPHPSLKEAMVEYSSTITEMIEKIKTDLEKENGERSIVFLETVTPVFFESNKS